MVAFSGLLSLQVLQVLPTLMYSMPSGPKASVRFGCCPESGKSPMIIFSSPRRPSGLMSATKTSFTVTR